MVSRSVYGSRQIGGSGRGRPWFNTHSGDVLARSGNRGVSVLGDTGQTSMTHNARHRRRMELPTPFTSVPQAISTTPPKSSMFTGVLRRATVRKTVASANGRQCKMSLSEVLISATLNVRGEMAEWPKAAVC